MQGGGNLQLISEYIHRSKLSFVSKYAFAESSFPTLVLLSAHVQRGVMKGQGYLRGAEARIGLGAASTGLGGDAGSHGAGNGVAGAAGALQGLFGDHLL